MSHVLALPLALGLVLAAAPAAPAAVRLPAEAERLEGEGWERLGRGDVAGGDSVFILALAARRAERPPVALGEARSLSGLAEARRVRRKYAEAESISTAALAFAVRDGSSDRSVESRVRETRANLFAERWQPEAALPEIDSALALTASIVPVDSSVFARQLVARARVVLVAGRLRESLEGFHRAIDLQERVLGPEHVDLAATHYLAATVASRLGDYLVGREHAEQSVAIRERALGPDHPFVAMSLLSLGGAKRDLGDYDGALAALARAEAIQRAVRPPNPGALSSTLSSRGGVLLLKGDGPNARAAYEEVIALRDQLFGPGKGEDLFASARMALALLLEGRAEEARARVEKGLAETPKLEPLVHPEALAYHAWAAYRLGDRATARTSLERSWVLSDSLLGSGSPRTLETLGQLAALDWADGRRADALRRAIVVEERSRALLSEAADVLSEREALDLARVRESGIATLVALAADSSGAQPGAAAAALDALVRARILVLDQGAAALRAVPRSDSTVAPLVRELEAAGAELAALRADIVRGGDPDSSALAAAQARRERAERALGAASGAWRGASARSAAGGADIAAQIPRGWALASFVRVLPPAVERFAPAHQDPAAARYVAFVLRAGETAPRAIPLAPAAQLEAAIDRWLGAVSRRPGAKLEAAEERRAVAAGATVRRLAWDPVVAHLDGVDTIAWVPDGALHRIEISALPAAHAGRYLVEEGPLLVRLTAERDLLPLERSGPAGVGLFAVGDVDFDAAVTGPAAAPARPAAAAAPRMRLERLPATGREVESIARMWRDAAMGDVDVRVGADASEAAFRRSAPGRRVLHLATHGFATAPVAAPLADAGVRAVGGLAGTAATPAMAEGRAVPRVPGLALAGANRARTDPADDGFLTAGEIADLDLSRADWAVLSACETGLAEPGAVEAVQGLHRAFRRAGVRSVVLSLWSVDDAATADWMGALYRARFAEGLGTAAAVRAAHRSILTARRLAGRSTHPFHWAGFIASGDPR